MTHILMYLAIGVVCGLFEFRLNPLSYIFDSDTQLVVSFIVTMIFWPFWVIFQVGELLRYILDSLALVSICGSWIRKTFLRREDA